MTGEFDGAPLVAGTVRGVRRFRVDELGRLRSPQQGTVWRPGDNEAECRRNVVMANQASGMNQQYVAAANAIAVWANNVAIASSGPHSFASCRCGFYAYSDGHDAAEYGGLGTVTAVVEGWGDVMVGTRGFRAPHARVLAVHVPDVGRDHADGVDPGVYPWRWQPLYRWFHRRFTEETCQAISVPVSAAAVIGAIVLLVNLIMSFTPAHDFLGAWVWIVSAVVTVLVGVGAHADAAWDDLSDARLGIGRHSGTKSADAPSAASVAALRANYPDVKFYSSYPAMVAAFPPSPGEKPTPANTPDFWERP